jgi:hypothetical protein
MSDFVYSHVGIHCVLPEISGSGIDYDGDGYFTWPETERWHREVMKNKYVSPWKPYQHPILGAVEIGGDRQVPPAIGERARFDSECQYDWILYIANLSPLLRIKNVTSEAMPDGRVRIKAVVRNDGGLSTYVTRNAIAIERDYPALAKITVSGGSLDEEHSVKNLGHILGKWSYIRYWIMGEDRSTKTVEWIVKPDGNGPCKVTVEAKAHKAGYDKKEITVK